MRTLILVITWVVYVGLTFMTIACLSVGSEYYYLKTEAITDGAYVGLSIAVYWAAPIILPVMIRWKLNNATWGTFCVYTFLLSIALIFQGTFQGLLEQYWLATIFFLLSLVSFGFSVYFFCKNYIHTKSIVEKSRSQRRNRRR